MQNSGVNQKIIYYTLSFLLGAMILDVLSIVQKLIIGAPITLIGFLVPSLFGSLAGVIIARKHAKLKDEIKLCKQIEVSLRAIKIRATNQGPN